MLAQIPLNANLAETLEEIARQRGLSLEEVVDDVLRGYMRQARREKIQAEAQHFRRMHDDLRNQFLGQHVAVHDGQVVDHDADPAALVHRVRERFGRAPVLVTEVRQELMPEFTLRSPRLQSSS
jgi:hypothetical protein